MTDENMEALIGTAHDACSRKVHAAAKGYFKDPFAAIFQRDTTIMNSPLMNRGHWLRVKAVENSLRNFAQLYDGETVQVVSLGAGVDTLYFRWAADHTLGAADTAPIHISKYLEIDFEQLVSEKVHAIQRHHALKDLVDGTSDASLQGIYEIVSGDLCSHDSIMNICSAHLDPKIPTFIIAECVFVYIDARSTTALMSLLCNEFFKDSEKVMIFTYDAMGPNDRFGEMMIRNLGERGIFLRGIADLPTTDAHVARALSVGFKSAQAWSMKKLYFSVPRETQTFLNKIEMIDDWDEWNLVHDHYCIMLAWKGGDGKVPPIF